MTGDELEFLISQRLDGTLDADAARALDRALATDADARDLLARHERLDAALRASRVTLQLDDDALGAQIADGVAAMIDDRAAVAAPLRMPDRNWTTPLAAAATLAIGLTVGVLATRGTGRPASTDDVAEAPASPAITTVALAGRADADLPAGRGVATVAVGVPANLTPAFIAMLYHAPDATAGRVSIRPAAPGRDVHAFD